MKDGDQVVVKGSVNVYERDGRYQVYAQEISLEGRGILYERFLALKKRTGRDGDVCTGLQAVDSDRHTDAGSGHRTDRSGDSRYFKRCEAQKSRDFHYPVSGAGTGEGAKESIVQEYGQWMLWAWTLRSSEEAGDP